MDSQAAKATDMEDAKSASEPRRRNLARSYLEAGFKTGAALVERAKSSSYLAKVGIEAIEKINSPLTSFAKGQWEARGDPLLTTIDDTLDVALETVKSAVSSPFSRGSGGAVTASSSAGPAPVSSPPPLDLGVDSGRNPSNTVHVERKKTTYNLFWEQIKTRFMNTRWFAQVNKILLENGVVEVLRNSVLRPAEIFFNTATEVYSAQPTLEGFLGALKRRVGRVWDTRLASMSTTFWRAARAFTHAVGAQKAITSFLNLGRATQDMAVTDLCTSWSKLSTRDGKTESGPSSAPAPKASTSVPTAGDRRFAPVLEPPFSTLSASASGDGERGECGDGRPMCSVSGGAGAGGSGGFAPNSFRRKMARSSKQSRRKKGKARPLPYANRQTPDQILRARLLKKNWFQDVNRVLNENQFISALSKAIVPSQHFFDTSLNVFRQTNNAVSPQAFSNALELQLGHVWNDKLEPFAMDFYHAAKVCTPTRKRDSNGSAEDGGIRGSAYWQ